MKTLTIKLELSDEKYGRGLAMIQATNPIPLVDNPDYVEPQIDNPDFVDESTPTLIDNPDYTGEPKQIPKFTPEQWLGEIFSTMLFTETKRYETRMYKVEAAKETQESFIKVV